MKPKEERHELMLVEAKKLAQHIYSAYIGTRDAVVIHCPEMSDEIIKYLKSYFNTIRRDSGGYMYFKRTSLRYALQC